MRGTRGATMTKVGLKEASKLAGVATSTIVRAHKKGVLSPERDAFGRNVYDVSELARVFGTLNIPDTPRSDADEAERSLAQSPMQRLLEQEIEALKRENAQLSETLADARQERDRWRDAHDRVTALLTDQRGQKAGFWGWLTGKR